MDARTTELAARVPSERRRLQELAAQYAPSALGTIAANAEQAQVRLTFAEERLAQADTDLASGRRTSAVAAVRAVEQALGQAALLLDAVATTESDLRQATGRVVSARTDLQHDLAEARALIAHGEHPAEGELNVLVARAGVAMSQTDDVVGATPADPLAALRQLEMVDEELDRVLTNVRDAQEQAQQSARLLAGALFLARVETTAAESYIATRRGAVGAQARTRLATAVRSQDRAAGA